VKEGNWDFGLLEKFILTWDGICQKRKFSFKINIPLFHHSLAQTWHAGPAFMGTASETLQRQKCFPGNSRQGRPLFHMQGKNIGPRKSY
jgi:hypothetical protein